MNKGDKPKDDVFNVERIRQIIELMEQHDLSEVDLQQGDEKIKLNRGSTMPPVVAAPAVAAPVAPAAAPASPSAPAAADPDTITINAETVGTFYARPTPEAEPFVKVGDSVSEDTVVCIIEAMKVFNEIPAECRGKIVEVLVDDQQPVDFGKPLFRVKPNN